MRGLGVAGRVVRALPAFFRYMDRGLFLDSVTDREPSAMFVLTQFPRETSVDLEEFLQGAERVAHTVFEQMYALDAVGGAIGGGIARDNDGSSKGDYLESVTTSESISVLMRKPVALKQRLGAGTNGTRLVLEQLTINRVALASVDYYVASADSTSPKNGEDAREREWLALEVAFDVMEHVQLLQADGIDDQRMLRTCFQWTFESEVTSPEQLEWVISRVSPFREEAAIVRASK